LLLARKINNAAAESIGILRGQSMCNIKLIERSSKSMKDPNPLSSTLSVLSQKYPLSVDVEKTKKYKVPLQYLLTKNGKPVWDTHNTGRVLCKKEAIEWWMDKSEMPTQELINVIDILYRHHRGETEKYYSSDWNTGVRFGITNVERRVVNTNDPIITADRRTREKLVETVLFPQLVVPYEEYPDYLKQQLVDLMGTTIGSHISLPSQIRILLNQLDPRARVLPIIPGTHEGHAELKHAIMGPNFVMRDVKVLDRDPLRITEKWVVRISQLIIQKARELEAGPDEIKKALMRTWHGSETLETLIRQRIRKEPPEIKVMKSILCLSVDVETICDGLTTSPQPANITPMANDNASGTTYRTYLGDEVVSYKYGDCRGQFTHNGTVITNITMNYTTSTELVDTLCEIGVYCRYGFRLTKSKDYSGMRQEARAHIRRNIDLFLRTVKGGLKRLVENYPDRTSTGILHLSDSSEYQVCGRICMNLRIPTYHLLHPTTQQVLAVPPFNLNEVLPDNVKSTSRLLINNLSLKELIRVKMSEWDRDIPSLVEWIVARKFKNGNFEFGKFFELRGPSVSASARFILLNIIRENLDKGLLPFYYCWAWFDPQYDTEPSLETLIPGIGTLHLLGNTGFFRHDEETNQYSIFNVPMGKMPIMDYRKATSGLLLGFRILNHTVNEAPMLPLLDLVTGSSSIADGMVFNTFFEGTLLSVVKDSTVRVSMHDTIARQVNAYKERRAEASAIFPALKRKWLASANSLVGETSKRPRVEDSDDGGVEDFHFSDDDISDSDL
jgi:hypothetical protein